MKLSHHTFVQIWRMASATALISLASQTAAEELTAFTEPYRDIDVAASEMGTLAELHIKEGDRVTQGQLLGTLDDQVLQASLKMVETGMNSRGKLNSAAAELKLQVDRLQKLIGLRERQHASQQEVDRTVSQKEIAQANLESVQDEVKIKTMEYARIQAELLRRRLVSPIDGTVTVIYKEVGEFASANDPIVAKVVQLDPLLVQFSVPMNLTEELSVDSPVSITVDEVPTPQTGYVEFVSPTADAQSGTVRVRIRVPNPAVKLPCGAPCRLLLAGQSSEPNSQVAPLADTEPTSDRLRKVKRQSQSN